MCKISVIIPCYNICERVEDLFEMYQCKEFCDYELIFVDDCSTDNSFEEMRKHVGKFSNYKVLKTERNGGPGVARNCGLQNASGKYVMFCDSDDKVNVSVLNDISSFLDEHEDADLLVFPYSIKRNNKVRVCDEYSQYKIGDTVRVIDVAADSGTPCSKIFRNKIIQDNNIQFPARKSGEDKCFVVKYCTVIDKVYKVDYLYYTYAMNKMSLTHRKLQVQKITTTFEILQTIYQNYFPEIVDRMYVETFLLTYAKHFSGIREKNKTIKQFYKLENEKHPDWINYVNYKNQSLYRKLIYKAMYKSSPIMIKAIMAVRGILY